MRSSALLIATLGICAATAAQAQVDRTGQTTARELADLRRLGEGYIDGFNFVEIDWQKALVYRVDLDDDGRKEAILRWDISELCGASTCQMIVVKWTTGTAALISAIDDSELVRLKTKTNGWHDLWGHYYTYKWDGRRYQPVCLEGNACDPDTRTARDGKK